MSEKETCSNTNEDDVQSIENKRDDLVRKIWKIVGEKGLLVYLPLLLGSAGMTYGNINKTEMDKNHQLACGYHENKDIRQQIHKENGSPDCTKSPSSELMKNSANLALYGTAATSALALGALVSSRKIAK